MKFIKLSIFALTMGLFIASCGNSESTEGAATEETAIETPSAEATPEATPVDTAVAPTVDSAAQAQ